MNNQSRIPAPETRARHIAKLRELNSLMDEHIMDLDELNVLLEAQLREQCRRIYRWRQQKRTTAPQDE
jgi:hypothetical protein